MWLFDTHIYCEIFTTIRLKHSSSHIITFVAVVVVSMRMLKLCSHSSFLVYNAIMLTRVTMQYLRSPEFVHLLTESLYCLTNISHFLHPSAPGNHHTTFCFYEFDIFRFHMWVHKAFVFLSLAYFIYQNAFKVHPCCHKWQDFLLLYG